MKRRTLEPHEFIRGSMSASRQCFDCRFFAKLQCPELKNDFGFCNHQDSPYWYQVLFEHCGCEYWESEGVKKKTKHGNPRTI